MSSVAEILQQMAENAGRARLQSGALWGSTVANLGALPLQIRADQQHQQDRARFQAQQDAQALYAKNADTRATKDQAFQDAADARKTQEQALMNHAIGVGYVSRSDPKQPFNTDAASQDLIDAGAPHLTATIHEYAASLQPKLVIMKQGEVGFDPRTRQPIPGMSVDEKPPAPSAAGFAATANDPTKTPEERARAKDALATMREPAPKVPGPGTVHDTPQGLVRIGEDNTVTPLGVKGYHPPTQAATAAAGSADNVKETIAGMADGSLPPVLPGRASKEYTALLAEAHRQGYDLASAATDWNATQKHFSTLNGAQQTRLRQAIATASDSLGVIEGLGKQWQGGKFPALNKLNLAAAKGGLYGPAAQQIATNLEAQITDVVSELGNVYMGGNSPTDHALSLAQKNLSADWTMDQLLSAVKLARTNLQIRENSIRHVGAITSSNNDAPATPPPATSAADPLGLFGPKKP